MRLRHFACASFLAIAFPSTLAVLAACSDDKAAKAAADSGTDTATSATPDTGTTTPPAVDSGPPVIRCSDSELAANDFTDAGDDGGLVISFPLGGEPAQYTNHCATVKAGASVTFTGGFMDHPLEPAGGDSPNPIPVVQVTQPDDQVVVTMPDAGGTFGYECQFHPTIMFGAVRVVP